MLGLLFSNPYSFIIWAIALLLAITVHEFSHALAATQLGDPTPKLQGRLTLNPLAHLDPLGTLMLLLIRFGWGKPVQFDPFNLENPRRDAAIISLAGPASNFILATLLSLLLKITILVSPFSPFSTIIPPIIFMNIALGVFNLIPIHPLDGGKILVGLLPQESAKQLDLFLNQYGIFVLILLIFPIFGGTSPVFYITTPLINFALNLLLPGIPLI